MSLEVYDDYTRHLGLGFLDTQNTVDVDFQHHLSLWSRNDIVWGLGARLIDSDYGNGYAFTLVPQHRQDHLFSAFFEDELRITNSLSLTIGSKVEHNSFTGLEFEPSAQLVWTPTEKQTVWFSASRAIREPSSVDVGILDDVATVPLGPTIAIAQAVGNPNIKAEELRDFETGYRAQASKRLSLDVTGFAGLYRNLESIAALAPYVDHSRKVFPYLISPVYFCERRGSPNLWSGILR